MGLFDRLRTLVSSNVNSAFDSSEDPATTVGLAIDELKTDLKKAREDLVSTVATAKRLDAKTVELRAESTTWEDRAASAIRAGDDGLAREALARKLAAQKKADENEGLAANQRAEELRMRDIMERAETRLRELESRRASLTADLRRARGTGAGVDNATSRLERSLDRVDAMDAELEAHAVLDDPQRAKTDAALRALEKTHADSKVEDELAALKRKLEG